MPVQKIDWGTVAGNLGFLSEEAMWRKFYVEDQMPIPNLSERFQVSKQAVRGRLQFYAIARRPRGGANRVDQEGMQHLQDIVDKLGVTGAAEALQLSEEAIRKVLHRLKLRTPD